MAVLPVHLRAVSDGGIGGEEDDSTSRLLRREAALAPPIPEPTDKGRIAFETDAGMDQAGVGGEGTDGARLAQPAAQLHGEINVAELGLPIGSITVIPTTKLEIIPMQTRSVMRA